jgi:hypothetical protein
LAKFQAKAIAATVAQTGMTEAQAAAALGFKTVGKEAEAVASSLGHATGQSIKIRESLVLLREGARGDFTRMAGSASILAGAFGLITAETVAMAAAIALPVAALGALIYVFSKGQEEAAKLNNALAVTNGYSGVTASSFEDMAARIAKASDSGIGKTKANIEAMVASGKYTGDTIDQLVAYSQKLAELTGQDSSKIVQSFDNMKGSVVQFAVKHEESYHDLTLAQIDYIAQLEKAGKHHEAELAFATDINTKVQALSVQYGTLQNVMHGVANTASDLWDKILGIGRPDTTLEKLNKAVADLKAKSDDMLSGQGSYGAFAGGYTNSPSDVSAQAAVVRQLTAQLRKEQADAAAKAKAAQDQDDAIRKKYDNKGAGHDDTGQRTAAVDAAIAQAQAQELQAQLGLVTDIRARAELQQQIIAAQTAEEQARVQRQIAEIAADKGLSQPTKALLTKRLEQVQATEQETANLKARLIDEQAYDGLLKQNLDYANAQRDAQASLLQLQQGLARNAGDRQKIELQLIDLATAKAQADAQEILASKTASDAQKNIAQITIDNLPDQHALQVRAANEQAADDIAKEILSVETGRRDALIGLYDSQKAIADYGFQQRDIDLNILKLQQQIEKLKLEEVVNSKTASDAEKKIAQAQLDVLGQKQANEIKAAQGTFLQSYDRITGAIDNMTSAFGQHDWVHATSSLIEAMGSAGQALGPDGLGAVLSSVSQALAQIAPEIAASIQIGQAGGAAFAKATGGNSENAKLGGFFGLAGGIIGSFFGESDAAIQKRKTENAAAASAADAAWQSELKHRTEAETQEITLANLAGDSLRATNLQRQQELNSLEAASRARQQAIYDIQDQIAAAQKALDDSNSGVQTAAQQLQSIGQAALQASQSLSAFYESLTTGQSALNSPLRQYTLTKTALVGVNTRIASGDQSAFGDVQGSVSAFLQAAQAYAPNKQAYGRDLAFAEKAVADAKAQADSQVSIAQQQLDAAQAQISGLQALNTSVLTVAQAVANLQAALTGQAGAQSGLTTAQGAASAALDAAGANSNLTRFSTPDYAYYVQHNPDLYAQFQAQTGFARKRSITEYGQLMWTSFDNSGRQYTPYGQAFAAGGAFDGPVTDILRKPTQLNVGTAGEAGEEGIMPLTRINGRLGVRSVGSGANDNASVVAAVNALAGRLDRIEAHTRKASNILQRVNQDGESLQTTLKVPA